MGTAVVFAVDNPPMFESAPMAMIDGGSSGDVNELKEYIVNGAYSIRPSIAVAVRDRID